MSCCFSIARSSFGLCNVSSEEARKSTIDNPYSRYLQSVGNQMHVLPCQYGHGFCHRKFSLHDRMHCINKHMQQRNLYLSVSAVTAAGTAVNDSKRSVIFHGSSFLQRFYHPFVHIILLQSGNSRRSSVNIYLQFPRFDSVRRGKASANPKCVFAPKG